MEQVIEKKHVKSGQFWLGVFACFAIVWSLMGVVFFLLDYVFQVGAYQNLTAAEMRALAETPFWAKATHSVAVFAAFFGSVSLLLRHQRAYYLFAGSFFMTLITGMDLLMRGVLLDRGTSLNSLSASAVVITMFLFWFTHEARTQGWLKS